MKLNQNYAITSNNQKVFLVNTENGDIFEINDVTKDILQMCNDYNKVSLLAENVFSKYCDSSENFSKNDLCDFIQQLIEEDIIEQ